MKGIIYKYVSPSDKVYIGQTIEEKKREKMKGRQTHLWTDEMRNKLSESMIGKKDSEEVRRKKK